MEFYTPGICILVKEKPETIRKCRNMATACHNSELHPLNSVNWNLLRICKSLWGHTISQGEKRAKKLENFSWLHLGLWQAVFPLNYSVLKTLHTFERLKISSRVKAATCFVLTTGMQSRIYNLLKQKKACSFMKVQTMLLFRSGFNTKKKRRHFGRTQRILWFAATPEVSECSGFKGWWKICCERMQ